MVNRVAQKDYEAKLANNSKKDSESFLYVNNNKKFSTRVGPLKNPNYDMIISHDKQMANVMVFNKESSTIFPKSKVNFDYENNKILTSIDINEKLVLVNC